MPGDATGCGVEQLRDPRPARIGLGRHDRHRAVRHPRLHVRMHDHRTRARDVEQRRITPVVEKADLPGPGGLQRRDPLEHALMAGGHRSARGICDFSQAVWPASLKEAVMACRCGLHASSLREPSCYRQGRRNTSAVAPTLHFEAKAGLVQALPPQARHNVASRRSLFVAGPLPQGRVCVRIVRPVQRR